jgi:hypothetical protein
VIERLLNNIHIVTVNYPLRNEIKPLCLGRIIKYEDQHQENVFRSITTSHRIANCVDCLEIRLKKFENEVEELKAHIVRAKRRSV